MVNIMFLCVALVATMVAASPITFRYGPSFVSGEPVGAHRPVWGPGKHVQPTALPLIVEKIPRATIHEDVESRVKAAIHKDDKVKVARGEDGKVNALELLRATREMEVDEVAERHEDEGKGEGKEAHKGKGKGEVLTVHEDKDGAVYVETPKAGKGKDKHAHKGKGEDSNAEKGKGKGRTVYETEHGEVFVIPDFLEDETYAKFLVKSHLASQDKDGVVHVKHIRIEDMGDLATAAKNGAVHTRNKDHVSTEDKDGKDHVKNNKPVAIEGKNGKEHAKSHLAKVDKNGKVRVENNKSIATEGNNGKEHAKFPLAKVDKNGKVYVENNKPIATEGKKSKDDVKDHLATKGKNDKFWIDIEEFDAFFDEDKTFHIEKVKDLDTKAKDDVVNAE